MFKTHAMDVWERLPIQKRSIIDATNVIKMLVMHVIKSRRHMLLMSLFIYKRCMKIYSRAWPMHQRLIGIFQKMGASMIRVSHKKVYQYQIVIIVMNVKRKSMDNFINVLTRSVKLLSVLNVSESSKQ